MNRRNLSDQPVFWVGQVVPKQDANKTSLDRWGSRVKVRIMGIHSASGTETPDSALFEAQVLHPTSHGSLNMTSTGITGGEMVFGMYLNRDGTTLKNPFILGVLPRTRKEYDLTADESVSQQSSEFKRVQPYWANNPPASYNTSGGQSEQSNSPLSLPQQDFFSTNPNN
jgi:hypothetical protein